MNEFLLHPEAYTDLEEIRNYIDRDSPRAADRLLEELFAAFRLLAEFPHLGHARDELTNRPIKFHLVRNYLIAYTPHKHSLVVLAVIHGHRDLEKIAKVLRRRT